MSNPGSYYWSEGGVKSALEHVICCPPDCPPCNLRVRDDVDSRSAGHAHEPPEWARFQLAAHARADLLTALGELWPETAGVDFEHLSDDRIRAMSPLAQAVWVKIIRGPFKHGDRTPLPDTGPRPASRFGFVSKHAAEKILGRRWATIAEEMETAVAMMVDWLNWGEQRPEPAVAPAPGCTPRLHFWGYSGTPAALKLCRCGRVAYGERALVRTR